MSFTEEEALTFAKHVTDDPDSQAYLCGALMAAHAAGQAEAQSTTTRKAWWEGYKAGIVRYKWWHKPANSSGAYMVGGAPGIRLSEALAEATLGAEEAQSATS